MKKKKSKTGQIAKMFNFKCWESFTFWKWGILYHSVDFRHCLFTTTQPNPSANHQLSLKKYCVIYEKFIMTSVHLFFFRLSAKAEWPTMEWCCWFSNTGNCRWYHFFAPVRTTQSSLYKGTAHEGMGAFFLPSYFEITWRRKLLPPLPPGAHLRGRKWGFRKPLTPGLHFHSIPTASS